MITKTALSLLSKTYLIACGINAVPYRWDPANLKLTHTTSKIRLTLFYLNISLEWLYTGFKAIRLFYAGRHATFFVTIIHVGWLSRDILLSSFHLTSIRRREVVLVFFNKFLYFDQEILPEFTRKQNLDHVAVGTDWCKLYHLGISYPVCISLPFFLALFGWVLASHPQFLASLFTEGMTDPPTEVKVWFLVLEFYIGYTSFFACYFYTCTLFCVIQSIRFSLKILSYPPQKFVDYAQSVDRSKKMYRTLQVLNNYLNDCWRSIIAPIQQFTDLIMGSTFSCAFIKYLHTHGFVTLLCFIYQVLAVAGCTSSTYSIAGRMPRWTERVFTCWKRWDFDRIVEGSEDQSQSVTFEKETAPGKDTEVKDCNSLIIQSLGETLKSPVENKKIGIGSIGATNLVVQKFCAFRRSSQKKHLKLFMKSCQPLHMRTSFFFVVSRKYGLGWFSWYVENTVSLILAFEDFA